jgi:hypothetical protein
MKFKVPDENVGPAGLDLLRHVTTASRPWLLNAAPFGAADIVRLCGVKYVIANLK